MIRLMRAKQTIYFICAIVLSFIPTSSPAQFCITDFDISNVPELAAPGSGYDLIAYPRSITGVDGLVFNIRGYQDVHTITNRKIHPIDGPFPHTGLLSHSYILQNGDIVGLGFKPRTIYQLNVETQKFEAIAGTNDYYWGSFEHGSKTLFVKLAKNGPLLELINGELVPSKLNFVRDYAYKEFLPWYSKELDGFITASFSKLWFTRRGEDSWTEVTEQYPKSYNYIWGYYEQGSTELLSPDGKTLKVISKNKDIVKFFSVVDGRPSKLLDVAGGKWEVLQETGEIVGWQGHLTQYYFDGETDAEMLARPPQFSVIPPNARKPIMVSTVIPRRHISGGSKTMPNTFSVFHEFDLKRFPSQPAVLFGHSEGFSMYRDGSVIHLSDLSTALSGDVPEIYNFSGQLFVATSEVFSRIEGDLSATRLLQAGPHSNTSIYGKVLALGNDVVLISTYGKYGKLYISENGEPFKTAPPWTFGIVTLAAFPDQSTALLAVKGGKLLLLEAECLQG